MTVSPAQVLLPKPGGHGRVRRHESREERQRTRAVENGPRRRCDRDAADHAAVGRRELRDGDARSPRAAWPGQLHAVGQCVRGEPMDNRRRDMARNTVAAMPPKRAMYSVEVRSTLCLMAVLG